MGERAPEVGDVYELETSRGLRYALMTHDHPEYGHLVRIAAGAHAERPERPDEIVAGEDEVISFTLLDAAIGHGLAVDELLKPSRFPQRAGRPGRSDRPST